MLGREVGLRQRVGLCRFFPVSAAIFPALITLHETREATLVACHWSLSRVIPLWHENRY